jgi:hypothetical protein
MFQWVSGNLHAPNDLGRMEIDRQDGSHGGQVLRDLRPSAGIVERAALGQLHIMLHMANVAGALMTGVKRLEAMLAPMLAVRESGHQTHLGKIRRLRQRTLQFP